MNTLQKTFAPEYAAENICAWIRCRKHLRLNTLQKTFAPEYAAENICA